MPRRCAQQPQTPCRAAPARPAVQVPPLGRAQLSPFALKFLRRSPPVKSLWLVALVLCAAISGFHLWRLWAAFNSGRSVLTASRPRPFVFPDVTVCPPSAFFRRDVSKPDIMEGSNRTFGFDILVTSAPALWRYVLYGNMSLQHLTQAQREYASRLALQSIFRYYINSSAVLSPLDMVAYCRYQGRLCDMDSFSIFFHPAHGSCITFHPPVRTVRATHLDSDNPGLVLQLHTLSPSNWLLTGDSQTSMTHRHSYTATLHPPLSWPSFHRVSHINSGRITSMRVSMTQVRRDQLDYDDTEDEAAMMAEREAAPSTARYCFGGLARWCRSYASRRADRLRVLRQRELLATCGCLSDSLPVPQQLADQPSCVGVRESILLQFDPRKAKYVGRYLYILDSGGEMRWIEDTRGYSAFKRSVDCFLKQFPKPLDEARLGAADPDPVSTSYRAEVDSGPWFQSTDTLHAAYISQNLQLYEQQIVQPEAQRRNVSLPVQAYLQKMQGPQLFSIPAHKVLQSNTGMLEVRPASLLGQQVSEVWLYPLSAFLADAGGALGLLLGASVVGLLESLDALLMLLCCRGARSRRQAAAAAAAAAASTPGDGNSVAPSASIGGSGVGGVKSRHRQNRQRQQQRQSRRCHCHCDGGGCGGSSGHLTC